MKRVAIILVSTLVVLFIASLSVSAFAAGDDSKPPSNVTITVVMPDTAATPAQETAPAPAPEPITMYPVDVRETVDNGIRQIIKTYELNMTESPADIPRAGFERSGWKFTLTDILRKETANIETREHNETVTLNTDAKEIEKILPLLPQTMEFKSVDGFVGILELDIASITVETAGTRTSSYTVNVTREYPHLSSNDSSLVPKTVADKGKTYNLVSVEWKPIRVEVIDYEDVPISYTAIATYSATGSSTVVTGYVTTAIYKGTLSKLAQGKAVYTAYFIGEEIRTPLEMTEPPKLVNPVLTEQPTPGYTTPPEQTAPPEPSVVSEPAAVSEPAETPCTAETPAETPTDAPKPPDNGDSGDGGDKNINLLYIAIPVAVAAAGAAFYIFKKRKGKTDNA